MNPVIEFTPEQTAELKAIWQSQKNELRPDDFTFINLKNMSPKIRPTIAKKVAKTGDQAPLKAETSTG